jgi:hypothetical protein
VLFTLASRSRPARSVEDAVADGEQVEAGAEGEFLQGLGREHVELGAVEGLQALELFAVEQERRLHRQAELDGEGVELALEAGLELEQLDLGAQLVLARLVDLDRGDLAGLSQGLVALAQELQALAVGALVGEAVDCAQDPVVARGDVHRKGAAEALVVAHLVDQVAFGLGEGFQYHLARGTA